MAANNTYLNIRNAANTATTTAMEYTLVGDVANSSLKIINSVATLYVESCLPAESSTRKTGVSFITSASVTRLICSSTRFIAGNGTTVGSVSVSNPSPQSSTLSSTAFATYDQWFANSTTSRGYIWCTTTSITNFAYTCQASLTITGTGGGTTSVSNAVGYNDTKSNFYALTTAAVGYTASGSASVNINAGGSASAYGSVYVAN